MNLETAHDQSLKGLVTSLSSFDEFISILLPKMTQGKQKDPSRNLDYCNQGYSLSHEEINFPFLPYISCVGKLKSPSGLQTFWQISYFSLSVKDATLL